MAKRKSKNIINTLNLTLDDIQPLTQAQQDFFDNYKSDKSQILMGFPGTGKTFLSLYKATQELMDPKSEYKRIVIVRSAVPTRDIGHLPGTLEEKTSAYELPYMKIFSTIFGRDDAYGILTKHDVVRFLTTSYIRGLTIDNAILVADEYQNLSAHEADSIITRIGDNSKIIFCGDLLQTDFTKISDKKGIAHFMRIVEAMPNYFDINHFYEDDIVRSGLVKNYIKTKMKLFPSGEL